MSMTVEAWRRLDHPRGRQPPTKQQIARVVKTKGRTSVLRGFVLTLLWYVMTWPSVMAWGLMMQHVLSSQTAELGRPGPTVEGKKNSSSWQTHKHKSRRFTIISGSGHNGRWRPGQRVTLGETFLTLAAAASDSEPWQTFWMASVPNLARMLCGASCRATAESGGPRSTLQMHMASSPVSSMATTGPEVINWIRLLQNGATLNLAPMIWIEKWNTLQCFECHCNVIWIIITTSGNGLVPRACKSFT